MKVSIRAVAIATVLGVACSAATPEIVSGSPPQQWNAGAPDCASAPQPPLQVQTYNAQTFVLRQSLCVSGEGNFLYLLVGARQSLLIDTGDETDAAQMPLAKTVYELLAQAGAAERPLIVAHTHRHQDHRAGDAQFAGMPLVTVIGYDLESVQKYFSFSHWPEGVAQIELGDRTIDVLPTPGHEATHIVFYDRNTALLFSGDMLFPGRLLIEETTADLASARRLADWVRGRPVMYVLGGHIERAQSGELFPSGSTYHPGERVLQMEKADVLALPVALEHFNGFYAQLGSLTLVNPVHNLVAFATVAIAVLAILVVGFVRFRRRRAARASSSTPAKA